MSKPNSGHFSGTTGKNISNRQMSTNDHNNDIIQKNKDGLDLREHPTKYKQLSSKKLKLLREKEKNRTITKEEYKHKEWQKRLTKRRNVAVKDFWKEERRLIKKNLPTTRNWSAKQRKEILAGMIPKYKGKTMASHHTFSVKKYPHLANLHQFIFPATQYEHIQGWHGGNTKNSLPGIPIKIIKEF